jgi:PAS domain S-box-containing protein
MISFLTAVLGDHYRLYADKNDRQLRVAIDAASVAIVVTDATAPDNPVVYVNSCFTRITGYTAEEVLGRNLRVLQGAETDPAGREELHRAIAEQRSAAAQLINYRKDGRPFWMQIEITPVFDDAGRLVRHVGVMRDVTERHERAAARRISEERLRAITTAIPLPMVIADDQGVILDANAQALSSLDAAELIGRYLGDYLEWSPLLAQAGQPGGVHQVEICMSTQTGGPLWVLASAVRFHMDAHDAVIVVFVDISEMKRKEEELSRARDDAERAIRAKSRFFAAASHDLRQPLQALALFTSALEMHIATPAAQTILQSIKISLSTMEEMFDALLDISRLEAGVLRASPEAFMVNDVLERLEMEFAPQAQSKGLELRVVPSSEAVLTDPALLGRIVRNFLSNAVRYTPSGKILLGCKRRGSYLSIQVGDTGPGIAENQRLAIFEEFFQGGEPCRSRSGLGLGLAIVQRLARLLSHRLDVRSVPGRGSIFSVDVPLAALPTRDGGDADEDGEEIAFPDLSGGTVVLIDDDPSVRQGLRMLLEDWGCTVVATPSGTEALEQLRQGGIKPDLILADLRLREQDQDADCGGVRVIDQLLDALNVEVPAFVFTGDTDTRDGQPGRGGRSFKVLHKPLNPLKLREVMAKAMGR